MSLLVLVPAAATAQEDLGGGVTHVVVDGGLDVGHQALLRRAIDGAHGRGDRLIMELSTPGGEVQLAWRIAKLLDQASEDGVQTVAWINDKALSAGALLALACDRIYMRSTASFGSAQTLQMNPLQMPTAVPADEVLVEKQGSSWRSAFRAFAETNNRSPAIAEGMVDQDLWVRLVEVEGEERVVSDKEWDDLRDQGVELRLVKTISEEGDLVNLTADEALAYKMADGKADSLDVVMEKIGMSGAPLTRVERTRSEDVAALLYNISWLLLVAGLLLGYVEFKTPGFGIPGFLSIACFAVLLFGRYLVGLADIPHIVLISIGFVLVAVELFVVPGTIWVGLLGAVCVLGGLIWSGIGSGVGLSHAMDREIALDSAFAVVTSAFAAMVGMLILSRFLPSTPILSWLVLRPTDTREASASAMPEAEGAHAEVARVGALGRALTALRPVGKVALDDEPALDHEARSSGPEIPSGARVRVVEARSGRLVVEAVD